MEAAALGTLFLEFFRCFRVLRVLQVFWSSQRNFGKFGGRESYQNRVGRGWKRVAEGGDDFETICCLFFQFSRPLSFEMLDMLEVSGNAGK